VHLGDARHRGSRAGSGGPEDLRDVVALLVDVVVLIVLIVVRIGDPSPVPDAVRVGAAAARHRARSPGLGADLHDRGQVAGDADALRGLRAADVLEVLEVVVVDDRRGRCRRRRHRRLGPRSDGDGWRWKTKKLSSEPMPALGSRHVPTKSNKNEVLQRENAFKVKVFKAILAASSFAIYRPKDSALSDRYPPRI
jgi:hypothetical protein